MFGIDLGFKDIIGPAVDLFGGFLGGKSARDNTRDQINFQRDAQVQSEAMQREFAQNGIRWKVEDAKAAGLHPLYAVGGAGASFAPQAASVTFDNGGEHLGRALSSMGQNIGRAVSAQQTPEQRQETALRLQLLRSQIGETDARTLSLLSEAARNKQGGIASVGMPPGIDAVPFPVSAPISAKDLYATPLADVIQVRPSEVVSSRGNDRSTTAGTNPWFMENEITSSGMKFRMPRSDEPGETWAEMPWYQKAFYMWKNAMDSGDATDWLRNWVMEYALGKKRRYVTTDPEFGNSRYGITVRGDHPRNRRPTLK